LKATGINPKGGNHEVKLAHGPNPDIRGGGYWGGKPAVKTHWVTVKDFAEASAVCRAFINKHELGGGNWTGGQVKDGNRNIARVSYNGRVWDLNNQVLFDPHGKGYARQEHEIPLEAPPKVVIVTNGGLVESVYSTLPGLQVTHPRPRPREFPTDAMEQTVKGLIQAQLS
jgi:hypothetical protein